MDTRDRYQIDDETLQTLGESVQSRIMTMVPVKVMKDSDGHTVGIQPLIKWVQRMPDGSQKLNDYPPITDAPVNFVSGGGTTFTHPVKEGDEGYALIASRSIDVWHEKGGMQPQVDARMHDLSDAIYCPGLRSTPRKLKDVSTTSAQMRSDDGKHMFDMHPENGPKMSADGGKTVISAHPKDGIGIKTALKLAVDATGGMDFKGAAHFKDAVTSATSFGAPALNGQTGGGFQGMLGGVVGFFLALAAFTVLTATGGHPDALQRASYALAAVVR